MVFGLKIEFECRANSLFYLGPRARLSFQVLARIKFDAAGFSLQSLGRSCLSANFSEEWLTNFGVAAVFFHNWCEYFQPRRRKLNFPVGYF
jgi:hypothetical protein